MVDASKVYEAGANLCWCHPTKAAGKTRLPQVDEPTVSQVVKLADTLFDTAVVVGDKAWMFFPGSLLVGTEVLPETTHLPQELVCLGNPSVLYAWWAGRSVVLSAAAYCFPRCLSASHGTKVQMARCCSAEHVDMEKVKLLMQACLSATTTCWLLSAESEQGVAMAVIRASEERRKLAEATDSFHVFVSNLYRMISPDQTLQSRLKPSSNSRTSFRITALSWTTTL